MYSPTHIDPVVSFFNTQGESVRATIVNLQRRSLVMEVYNPWSIVQVSEVLSELTVRMGARNAYVGKAVVISMVNTGLTAMVSVSLTDEWRELTEVALVPGIIGHKARAFVEDWGDRFRIRRDYQIVVNETRAFLADASRWLEQMDLTEGGSAVPARLPTEYFFELALPLMEKMKACFDRFNGEAAEVEEELAPAHRAFVQAALHPLILRAPFVFRTYTKPLGYAGDYQMVNQILGNPREGPSTYFQVVNTAFLQTAVATAHRHRIDILVQYLTGLAQAARAAGRPFRVLNVGCGPAEEIARFIETFDQPELLSFQLMDFSAETLDWTRERLAGVAAASGKRTSIEFVHDSVHQLLKRRDTEGAGQGEFDAVYCAGLFDYLSDKVCARLNNYFVSRIRPGGRLLVTNVHSANPERFSMEHILEWYLIYRDEGRMEAILPARRGDTHIYTDSTGVNVFAETSVAS
ncbi:extracellular factor (EF) 3-hydroxypalmitic acid methyl ester biosynthesis protein [Pseudoduganella lurida]|uniref:Extracellular factor (EF) 3-hydroxypalmitic acid methyl ester biosynthesis protein n=1 Tax=Pseudoduganella lurida TaxID=1036180 RepID=A0A562RIN4_9BURK|nr:class I SAM-dependent methyltransferase [Pseudoduganella lurida]TWI68947.1 extracellular factor (EF) 3-hydroxypalmitic acid methyl ester biosynthesis protein [Pseudoduganella lurida]